MIKNETPYNGKIKLVFEKDPEYTNGGKSFLNKIHLNLGFTKLVSRVFPIQTANGPEVSMEAIFLIKKHTGGTVGNHSFDGIGGTPFLTLRNSFMTIDFRYIGDIRDGWFYYKHNLKVCNDYPHGVAESFQGFELEGYFGYSHRGGATFKIGDLIFDKNYSPVEKDYEKSAWAEYKEKFDKLVAKADAFDLKWLKEDGIACVIPFNKRGEKIIENLEQAKQAAINLSQHLG